GACARGPRARPASAAPVRRRAPPRSAPPASCAPPPPASCRGGPLHTRARQGAGRPCGQEDLPDVLSAQRSLRAPRSATRGYSVPPLRLGLHVGPPSSPGFSGGPLSRLQTRSALIRAFWP